MRRLLSISIALCLLLWPVSAQAMTVVEKPVSFGFKKATTRTIDTVIVHATYNKNLSVQTLAGAVTLWKQYSVSPHYAIDPQGTVYRLVSEKNIAYHAGTSTLPNGEGNINTRSIGIELLYATNESPSAAQYKALQELVTDITGRYTIRYVLGHSVIAPGRKVDPWNFDWSYITAIFNPAKTTYPTTAAAGTIATLTTAQQQSIARYAYRKGCPVPISDLRTVTVPYYDMKGVTQKGVVVVNKTVTAETKKFFEVLFDKKFPIQQVQPIDAYQGDDDMSMAANNTSAFNCRKAVGSTTYSQHAYGTAIDVNPVQNPYVANPATYNSGIVPREKLTGAITAELAKALGTIGWQWGGDWQTKKDYQHFSRNGK